MTRLQSGAHAGPTEGHRRQLERPLRAGQRYRRPGLLHGAGLRPAGVQRRFRRPGPYHYRPEHLRQRTSAWHVRPRQRHGPQHDAGPRHGQRHAKPLGHAAGRAGRLQLRQYRQRPCHQQLGDGQPQSACRRRAGRQLLLGRYQQLVLQRQRAGQRRQHRDRRPGRPVQDTPRAKQISNSAAHAYIAGGSYDNPANGTAVGGGRPQPWRRTARRAAAARSRCSMPMPAWEGWSA